MADFDLAFSMTLYHEDPEGKGATEKDNNGALVQWGINAASWPGEAVGHLTRDDARRVYREIWDRIGYGVINPDSCAACAFDLSFNGGDATGVIVLQRAINDCGGSVGVDGRLGPVTANAANACDEKQLLTAMLKQGTAHYQKIVAKHPEDARYLNTTWLPRLYSYQKLTGQAATVN